MICARIDDPSLRCVLAIGIGLSLTIAILCCGCFYCLLRGHRALYRLKVMFGLADDTDERLPERAETAVEAAEEEEEEALDRCQLCLNNWWGTDTVQGAGKKHSKIAPLTPSEELSVAIAETDGEYRRAEELATRHYVERRHHHDVPVIPETIEETPHRPNHVLEMVGEEKAIEHHHPLQHHNTRTHPSTTGSTSRRGSLTYEHSQPHLPSSVLSSSVSHPVYPSSKKIHENELPVIHPHEHNPFHAWKDHATDSHNHPSHHSSHSSSQRRISVTQATDNHHPSSSSRRDSHRYSIIHLHHHDSSSTDSHQHYPSSSSSSVSRSHIDHPGSHHNAVTVPPPSHRHHSVSSVTDNADHHHHHNHHRTKDNEENEA